MLIGWSGSLIKIKDIPADEKALSAYGVQLALAKINIALGSCGTGDAFEQIVINAAHLNHQNDIADALALLHKSTNQSAIDFACKIARDTENKPYLRLAGVEALAANGLAGPDAGKYRWIIIEVVDEIVVGFNKGVLPDALLARAQAILKNENITP